MTREEFDALKAQVEALAASAPAPTESANWVYGETEFKGFTYNTPSGGTQKLGHEGGNLCKG
jgi:hypothetical protein